MIQNPFDCKISDLSEEQIRTVIDLILKESGQKSVQINAYKERLLEDMFWTEIQQLKNEIGDLMEIHVQFIGALRVKQKENQIASN